MTFGTFLREDGIDYNRDLTNMFRKKSARPAHNSNVEAEAENPVPIKLFKKLPNVPLLSYV